MITNFYNRIRIEDPSKPSKKVEPHTLHLSASGEGFSVVFDKNKQLKKVLIPLPESIKAIKAKILPEQSDGIVKSKKAIELLGEICSIKIHHHAIKRYIETEIEHLKGSIELLYEMWEGRFDASNLAIEGKDAILIKNKINQDVKMFFNEARMKRTIANLRATIESLYKQLKQLDKKEKKNVT